MEKLWQICERNVRGHLTRSHQVKMPRFLWTEEEKECFSLVIKEKKVTTIIDSKYVNNNFVRVATSVLSTIQCKHLWTQLSALLSFCGKLSWKYNYRLISVQCRLQWPQKRKTKAKHSHVNWRFLEREYKKKIDKRSRGWTFSACLICKRQAADALLSKNLLSRILCPSTNRQTNNNTLNFFLGKLMRMTHALTIIPSQLKEAVTSAPAC